MAAMGRNTELMIHRHLAGHTAKAVSEAIGGDETLISRFKSGERGLRIEQIGPFLEAVGLKLVANDEVTVDPKYLESLRNLAARGI